MRHYKQPRFNNNEIELWFNFTKPRKTKQQKVEDENFFDRPREW